VGVGVGVDGGHTGSLVPPRSLGARSRPCEDSPLAIWDTDLLFPTLRVPTHPDDADVEHQRGGRGGRRRRGLLRRGEGGVGHCCPRFGRSALGFWGEGKGSGEQDMAAMWASKSSASWAGGGDW